jgi:carboxypeptidase Taq
MTDAKTAETLAAFRQYVKKMKNYEEAVGVLYWDLRTGAPKKGVESRSEVLGMLSAEMFKMSVSEEMGAYLAELSRPEVLETLSDIDRKSVAECQKEYERSKKIPPEKYQEYVVLTSQAEAVWEEAKNADDFASFKPYLEKIVAFNREFIELWGRKKHPYDTLLDMYEPGMTVETLDRVFGELRSKLVPLVAAVDASPHKPETGFLRRPFAKEKQREFSLFILKEMGYDFQAGRLDETEHPFATGLNQGDVRVTTKYVPDDITFALFSSMHEGGHALYEQNLSPQLAGTVLSTGTSMGIHESQSRLWENMIGRSRAFWNRYYRDLQNMFPDPFANVSVDAFYRAINEAKPSLIRIEADELTYNLHIMIRYELEKALFSGDLTVNDLPAAWRDKYREYLGVAPENDRQGVLQDVHWAGGSFGYFPSYALGNMYAAQIMHTLHKEMPEAEQRIERGELLPIKEWLTEKIYRYGKLLDPAEIILRLTGEPLNPNYLSGYLEQKFSEIYRL